MNCCFIKKKRIVPKKVSYLIDDKISKDITSNYTSKKLEKTLPHKLRIVSPEPMQSSPRTIWDPIYSGNYLIVGLKHMIDPEKFITTMTAVKDTYENPITNSTLRLEV